MKQTTTLRAWAASLFLFPFLLQAQTQVELPTVSVVGGRYDAGFPLSISTITPNTNLYYTLDGTDPTESATLYTAPINISKTITLRVKGFTTGLTPSPTVTHSYFINVAHTFPIVALSFKKSDFFNDSTGIYVKYENKLEVPTNIELFEAGAKNAAFNQMVGVQIQGSTSAQLPQKSLEIKASGAYKELPYAVFPSRPFTSYKRFVLRNGGQDWGISLFRDELITSLGLKTSDLNGILRLPDLSMQDFRPSVVYFNGEYWGIHGIRERMNRFYVEQHFNLKSANYDMIENWGVEINNGDSIAFTAFYKGLANRNLADNTAFEQFKTELDVSNFLDYNVFNVFIDNTDWPSNNVRCFRPKPTGKWRFISYDHDFSFGLFQLNGGWNTGDATQNSLNRLFNAQGFTWPNAANSTLLFRKCMENANFKRDFINRMADMMNTLFKPERISQKINEFKTQYQPEIERHANRWGTPFPVLWLNNVEKLRNFGNQRSAEIIKHVKLQFPEITGTAAVTLNASPANGGSVNFSTLNLTPSVMPFTGTYFTNVDIPVTAIPAPGYVFKGWSDPSLSSSPTVNIRLSANKNLTAIFEASNINPCTADTEKPIFQNCPSNIALTSTQPCQIVNWTPPTVTDNCTTTPSVSSNYASGFCFSVGTTNLIYTATDNAGNSATCQFSIQLTASGTGNTCKRYKVSDVNNLCGCNVQRFAPYSILIAPPANSANCFGTRITAQTVKFEQNPDGTATLTGTFRDSSWQPILINIKLAGGTTTPPTGAPFRAFCMQSDPAASTNGWFYYPTMTGTYKLGTNAELPITLNGTPFQVGIGAGQQRVSVLGASAKFLIGGLSSAQFNMLLTNEETFVCSPTISCDADTQPPIWSNCPQNISLTTTQTCAVATWATPTSTDNCTATPSVISNFSSGNCFPIGTTSVIYTATDAKNNAATCRFNVIVQQNTPVSADMSLTLTSNPIAFTKFSPLTVQVTAKNIGNSPLTNVKIYFPYPAATVNGGSPRASNGTWVSYCGTTPCNEWRISSLAVGATETLSIPLFVLNPTTALNVTAQLKASTPTDGNVSNNQPILAIPAFIAPLASNLQKATQYLPILVQNISPNPTTDGSILVDLESIDAQKADFEFFTPLGKRVRNEKRQLEKGQNQLFFDIQDFENGIYFIVPSTQIGKHVPTKFVKMQ